MTELLSKYTAPSRLLHWLMAFIVAALFVTAWVSEDASADLKSTLMGMHKTFGILILGLVVLRILSRLVSPKIEPVKGDRRLQIASHAVHGVLYLLLLVMPLLGWAFVSAKGRAIAFFNVVDLPPLIEKNTEIARTFIEGHELGANILMVLVGAHVVAAVYHQFFLKDKLMERMLP